MCKVNAVVLGTLILLTMSCESNKSIENGWADPKLEKDDELLKILDSKNRKHLINSNDLTDTIRGKFIVNEAGQEVFDEDR